MDFLLIYEDGPIKVCNELTPVVLEEHKAQIVTIINTAYGAILNDDMDWEEIEAISPPPLLVDKANGVEIEPAPIWFYPHRAQDVKLKDDIGAWMNRDTSKVVKMGGRASGKTVANMPKESLKHLSKVFGVYD